MTRLGQPGCRVFAAYVCLLATALLYAPLAGAAWASRAMACCSGDHCNIPQHHHAKAPAQPASHEDCDHGTGGLMACSMSCCQSADHPAVTSMIFVLPQLALTALPNLVVRTVEAAYPIGISRFIQPLSPPPRIAGAIF